MALFSFKILSKNKPRLPSIKKCHTCFAYLLIHAEVCDMCKREVGKIDKYGRAQKPTDWMSYVRLLFMWCLFGLYMWWVFLQDNVWWVFLQDK
jgi:hypothetical protein